MIEMSLVGVRVEVPTNQPIVLLREGEAGNGGRYLPIFIGPPEATAIVYALQGMETPRPMTHDLFKTVLDELGVTLQQVVITELHDGTFFAEIEIDRGGQTQRISSRPSDALALAARYPGPVPIYAEEAVLDEAGVLFDQDEEETQIEEFREFLNQVRPEDFASEEGS
jgi:bifunctional DNase/RNase